MDTTFYNAYGLTEGALFCLFHLHVCGKPLTIGTPVPNTHVYVLDGAGIPVPVGAKGTMWLGGASVTRGYINQPQLTTERYHHDRFRSNGYVRFRLDKFSSSVTCDYISNPSILTACRSMMFDTRDIVRWRQDGSLELIGSLDDQVDAKVNQ